jgi:hypothetical protein
MVSKLLNAEHAHALLEKLCDYPLNSEHPRGKNKAIVFRSALGFTINGAERLRSIVLDAVLTFDAVETTPNEYENASILMIGLRGAVMCAQHGPSETRKIFLD